MANLKFFKGELVNLNNIPITEGNIYVTSDEKAMYVDVASDKRIRLGQIITTTIEDWKTLQPPYDTDAFYYISNANALVKYDGTKWNQINNTETLQTDVAKLKTDVSKNTSDIASLTAVVDTLSGGTATDLNKIKEDIKTNADNIAANVKNIEANTTNITNLTNNKADKTALATTDGKVASLESLTATQGGTIASNTEKIGENTKAIEDEVARATGIESGLRTDLGAVQSTITTLATKDSVTDLDSKIGAVSTRVGTIESDYLKAADKTELDEKITSASEAAAAADEKAVKAQEEVDALEEVVADLNTKITTVESEYKAADTQIRTDFAAADATTLNAAKADATEKANAVDTKVTALSGTVSNLTTSVNSQLEAVRQEFADADTALHTTITNEITDAIKTADAMTFKGVVAGKGDMPLTYQAGDTYKVTATFNNGTAEDPEWFYIGDLIVGKEDDSTEYYHVPSGYEDGYNPTIKANGDSQIQLIAHDGAPLGAINVADDLTTLAEGKAASGINLSVSGNADKEATIKAEFVWGEF